MRFIYRGGIVASWLTVMLAPPLLYYHDRKAEKQKLLKPTLFFDQMEFMKNSLDDNPKYHVINDVDPSIKNRLFCRLVPVSAAHQILGEITIENNRITDIKSGGHPEDNLLLSVYEYGYPLEGRDSLGRRILTLGIFQEGEQMPQITKDIVGRSLVVENEDREILAAGIVAKA